MIKAIFTILLFFPLIVNAQTDSLKGHIKSVREKLIFLDSTIQNMKLFSIEGDYGHYGFSSPEFTFSRFNSAWYSNPWVYYLNYQRLYDTMKNLSEETWYYKNDKPLENVTYEYDKHNNLIQKKTAFNDTAFVIKNFSYNESHLLLSSISYSTFRPIRYEYNSFQYDEDNRLIEIGHFDEYGEGDRTKFTYTSSGKLKQQINHSQYVWVRTNQEHQMPKLDIIGLDQLQEERIYDSADNLKKVKNFKADFYDQNKVNLIRSTTYFYDKRKRKVSEYYAWSQDTVYAYKEYRYNYDNLLKKESFFQPKDDQPRTEIEYFYDKDKNIEKVIYLSGGKKTLIRFTYKFDQNLNWIEQVKAVDEKPLYLRKRDLQYY